MGFIIHLLTLVVQYNISISINGTFCTCHTENNSISYNKFGKKDERVILIILDNSLNTLSKIITYIFASCDQKE